MRFAFYLTVSLFVIIISERVNGQNLPESIQLSADGRMLLTGKSLPGGLYDSAVIRTIYLQFPQPNYWQLLTANYQAKIDLPVAMTVDGVAYDSVGVRFKGQTSYMGATNSQKKSFNISLDYARPDQNLMGYKTLNLNNSFQDASFLREVFFQHQIRKHVPTAKSNFVQLYINGQSWGIYPNVQQLNKDFLDEWFFSNDGANWRADRPDGTPGGPGPGGGPGWGDGTAGINYLGADTTLYKTYYTLKSSDVDNPWDYLVATCNALNNTPVAQLPEILPNYLDIDRTLWFLASEIAFTDDDSYVFKGKMDYYLYYEPETGRITPIEYDGNSVMLLSRATNWGPFYNETKVNYPLLNKILAVPTWRQRYLAHLRTIIADEMNPAVCNPMLDNYKIMIDSLVQADPKKMTTYTQFNAEVQVLKNFINTRRNYLLSNPDLSQPAPQFQSLTCYSPSGAPWIAPVAGETPYVTAAAGSVAGIFRMNLFFATGLTGNFTPLQMFDDGLHRDGAAGDGLYGADLPPQTAGTWVRYYVEAVAGNPARAVSYMPAGAEHDVFVYQVQPQVVNGPVVINELMAANTVTVTDETGDYDDWIELYNTSNQPVNLGGYYLSDNPANPAKYEIPAGITIPADGYLIFWADEDGVDGPFHCNFKLSAAGEVLMLLNPSLQMVDSVSFGPQQDDKGYARVPNGTGPFQIQTPTFNASNSVTGVTQADVQQADMRMFPNPAAAEVWFETASVAAPLPLIVRSVDGRVMLETFAGSDRVRVSVRQWPNGLYVVQYGPLVRKLVVQK
jgi:hypothetical protein